MARNIIVWINLVILTIVFGVIIMIFSPFDLKGYVFKTSAKFWSVILLKLSGVTYRVKGLENLDKSNHYFFASNHESAFDIPLIFSSLPFYTVTLAKIELRKIPFLGWAMVASRHIFVDRKNREKSAKSLREMMRSFQKTPRSLLIFPEGARSLDGEIRTFKKGGIFLAIQLNMAVVPVAVCGTREIVLKHALKVQPGSVEFKIGKPINPEEWVDKDPADFANYVQQNVIKLKELWEEEKKMDNIPEPA
tara:strand:+ start:783 stop:1529 length:747 start_codon:yes stop_codon:yes gene_type:complete